MRSFLAILVFFLASFLVVFSQARAEVSCGVSSDALLVASLNSMKVLGVEEVCFKFDTSVSPRRILSAQSRLY